MHYYVYTPGGGMSLSGPNDESQNHGLCIPPLSHINLDECAPVLNESIKLPQMDEAVLGPSVPQFVTGTTVVKTEEQVKRPEPVVVSIQQTIVPSTGTKLVCTQCGTQDWHTLILRRKAGLIEGLCKQEDGSGCYPLATRRNCSYTYSNQIDCPQVAEYCVALGKERLNPRQCCRDHVGEMLRQGPLYTVWPLED